MRELFRGLDGAKIQGIISSLKKQFAQLKKSRARALIVHPQGRYGTLQERVCVILSPAYYWYRRSEVALKSKRAALRIAPSSFYGWLPEGQFRYLVDPEEGGYGLYAVDVQAVAAQLEAQGLRAELIDRIYFAQSALRGEPMPLWVDEESALDFVDGLCVGLPHTYLDRPARRPGFAHITGPTLRLGRVRQAGIARREFALAVVPLLLFGGAQTIGWYHSAAQASAFEQARIELLSTARLPETSFQLDAIERRLLGVASGQMALRDHLSSLLAAPDEKGHLIALEATPKGLKARFQSRDDEQEAQLVAALKARLPQIEVAAKDGILEASLTW